MRDPLSLSGGQCPVSGDFMRQVIPERGLVSQYWSLIGQNLTMKPSDWPLSHATPRWLRIKITTIHWPKLVSTPTHVIVIHIMIVNDNFDLDAITISLKWDWLCLYQNILIVSSSWSLLCYDLSRLQSESDSWQLTPSLQLGLSLVKSSDTGLWLAENNFTQIHLTSHTKTCLYEISQSCHELSWNLLSSFWTLLNKYYFKRYWRYLVCYYKRCCLVLLLILHILP